MLVCVLCLEPWLGASETCFFKLCCCCVFISIYKKKLERRKNNLKKIKIKQDVCMSLSHLGMVTHFVLLFCVLMAFSSSSSCPVFFSFLTKLFTAFSHHFSSCPPFCSPTPPIPPPAPPLPAGVFFHPRRRFTTGGVKGRMEDIVACVCMCVCEV